MTGHVHPWVRVTKGAKKGSLRKLRKKGNHVVRKRWKKQVGKKAEIVSDQWSFRSLIGGAGRVKEWAGVNPGLLRFLGSVKVRKLNGVDNAGRQTGGRALVDGVRPKKKKQGTGVRTLSSNL